MTRSRQPVDLASVKRFMRVLSTILIVLPYGTTTALPDIQKLVSGYQTATVSDTAIEVIVTPDLKLLDGRYSNLGWLQDYQTQ